MYNSERRRFNPQEWKKKAILTIGMLALVLSCAGSDSEPNPAEVYTNTLVTLSGGELVNPIDESNQVTAAAAETIGGDEITFGEQTVSMRLVGSNGRSPLICTVIPKVERGEILDTAGHCIKVTPHDSAFSPFVVDAPQGGSFAAKIEARYGDGSFASLPVVNVAVDADYLEHPAIVAADDIAVLRTSLPLPELAGLSALPTLPVTLTHLLTTGMQVGVIGYGHSQSNYTIAHRITMTTEFEGNDPRTANGFKLVSSLRDSAGTTMTVIGGDSGSAVFFINRGIWYQIGRLSGKYVGGNWDNWAYVSSAVSSENRARAEKLHTQVMEDQKPQPMHYLSAQMQFLPPSARYNSSYRGTYVKMLSAPSGTTQEVPILNTRKNPAMKLESMHLRAAVVADSCITVGEPETTEGLEINALDMVQEVGAGSTVTTTINLDLAANEAEGVVAGDTVANIPITDSCTPAQKRSVYVYPVAGGNNPDDPSYEPSSAVYSYQGEDGEQKEAEFNFTRVADPAAGITFMPTESLTVYPGISREHTLQDGSVVKLSTLFPPDYALCKNDYYSIYATIYATIGSSTDHLIAFLYGLYNEQASYLMLPAVKPGNSQTASIQIYPECGQVFLPLVGSK